MADAQIAILIQAVDEVSDKLNKIEKNIGNMAKNSKKQTESLGNAFTQLQGNILILGQAVLKVDNIISAYTNLQLRLENATERVTGAQDRLRNAQERLTDAQKSNQRVALNAEKLSLDEKKLKKELNTLYNAQAFAIRNKVNPASREYQDLLESIETQELRLKEVQLDAKEAQEKGAREIVNAQREVESATRGVTIAQNNLARANNAVFGTYVSLGLQSLSLAADTGVLLKAIGGAGGLTSAFGGLTGAIGVGTVGGVGAAATLGAAGALAGLVGLMLLFPAEDVKKKIDELVAKFDLLANSANAAERAIGKALQAQERLRDVQVRSGSGQFGGRTTRTDLAPKANPDFMSGPSVIKFNDFISRPGMQPVSFSPNDTIIGFKDRSALGGGTIVVKIENVYGINAQDISRALSDELYNKVSF